MVQSVRRAGESATLLLSCRAAALPGLEARLAGIGETRIVTLPPDAPADGALTMRDAIRSEGEALPFVVRLPSATRPPVVAPDAARPPASQAVPDLPLAASGGIRDGIEIAKAIALGAQACGVAGPFLAAALESAEAVQQIIDRLIGQLRIAAFSVGAPDIAALSRAPLFDIRTGTPL